MQGGDCQCYLAPLLSEATQLNEPWMRESPVARGNFPMLENGDKMSEMIEKND